MTDSVEAGIGSQSKANERWRPGGVSGKHAPWHRRSGAGKKRAMTYRIIYSLIIDLAPGPGGEVRQLVVPLSHDGSATSIELVLPKTRAIDLRVGDRFVFEGKRETVAGIRAYRENVSDVMPPALREG
jgi:hypothetical protein